MKKRPTLYRETGRFFYVHLAANASGGVLSDSGPDPDE